MKVEPRIVELPGPQRREAVVTGCDGGAQLDRLGADRAQSLFARPQLLGAAGPVAIQPRRLAHRAKLRIELGKRDGKGVRLGHQRRPGRRQLGQPCLEDRNRS
jgi:hypothetical protein